MACATSLHVSVLKLCCLAIFRNYKGKLMHPVVTSCLPMFTIYVDSNKISDEVV